MKILIEPNARNTIRNRRIVDWLSYKRSSGYIELELGLIDHYEYLRNYVNKE